MLIRSNCHIGVLATVAALIFSIAGCGGGGGGGGNGPVSRATATSATFGDLSGETDPDQDGTILVEYSLYSAKRTTITLALDFSIDGGETYSSCTEDLTDPLGGEPNPSDGLSGLSAGPGGMAHIFAWDSDATNNLPGVNLNCVKLRIQIKGVDAAISPFFSVLNNRSDTTSPAVDSFSAESVENEENDILIITYDEAVNAADAVDLSNYALENPLGSTLAIPSGSTISYDAVENAATIILDGDDSANLRFGTVAKIEVSNVRDLLDNEIDTASDGTAQITVDGDGANIPDDLPQLQAAIYLGSGNPQTGWPLVLLFDERVDADSGVALDDDDVDFWYAGDTLGWGSPLPVEILEANPNALKITLGWNPAFTLGTSKINVSHDNDAMIDLAGNAAYLPASPGIDDYVTIIAMEYEEPVIDLLTVNDVPQCLNGDGNAGGTMQVPRSGFSFDLDYHDEGGAGVDPETVVITASVPATKDSTTIGAGTNLVPYLTEVLADEDGASYALPEGMSFSTGMVTISAMVSDILANESDPAVYQFRVKTPTATQRPFRTTANPSQMWFLVFGRDLYNISISGSTYISVTATKNSNGTADFDEDLKLFGLNCDYPIDVTGADVDSNELMRTLIIDETKTELSNVIFDGANIEFVSCDAAGFPGNSPQVSYNSFARSLMAIGGDSDIGALGVAFIDRCNENQDNDTLYKGSSPYNPGTNLGIFTTRIFIYEVNGSYYGLFRLTFDDFIPGRGYPVGTHMYDSDILMDIAGTGPSVTGNAAIRRDAILTAVDRLARYIAVLSSHEMGHSMGVAVNGKMPDGLYGGDNLNFPGSTSNHINMSSYPGLFQSPNVNIMAPSTNFTYTNAVGTRFNRLNQAYLKEKAFYND